MNGKKCFGPVKIFEIPQ